MRNEEGRPASRPSAKSVAAKPLASGVDSTTTGDHFAPATLAELSRRLRDEGIARADGATDPWTKSCWQTAISYWASTGLPFGADECRELGVPEPSSPGAVGALFLSNCRAGLIKPVGFVQSRKASRHASWQRQWIGGDVG